MLLHLLATVAAIGRATSSGSPGAAEAPAVEIRSLSGAPLTHVPQPLSVPELRAAAAEALGRPRDQITLLRTGTDARTLEDEDRVHDGLRSLTALHTPGRNPEIEALRRQEGRARRALRAAQREAGIAGGMAEARRGCYVHGVRKTLLCAPMAAFGGVGCMLAAKTGGASAAFGSLMMASGGLKLGIHLSEEVVNTRQAGRRATGGCIGACGRGLGRRINFQVDHQRYIAVENARRELRRIQRQCRRYGAATDAPTPPESEQEEEEG